MSSSVTEIQKASSSPLVIDQGAKDSRDGAIQEVARNAFVVRSLGLRSLLEWTWSIILLIEQTLITIFREIFLFPDVYSSKSDVYSSKNEGAQLSPKTKPEELLVEVDKSQDVHDLAKMPPRLFNFGNTCYFSSVLQLVLSSGDFFTELFEKAQMPQPGDTIAIYEGRKPIFKSLQEFQKAINGGDGDQIQEALKVVYQVFQRSGIFEDFRNGGRHNQEDAYSFLGYLFEVLGINYTYHQTVTKPKICNTDDNDKKTESFILETGDKNVSATTNISYTFNVPMNSKEFNFQRLFDKEFEPEELDDYREKGVLLKGVFTEKRIANPLPEVIFVVLQRFQYDDNSSKKIETPVDFPANNILDLSKAVGKTTPIPYQLIGLSTHSGGVDGGHYTSDVLKNGQWYRTNDLGGQVKAISTDAIDKQSAYLFAFRRVSENVEPRKERQDRALSV